MQRNRFQRSGALALALALALVATIGWSPVAQARSKAVTLAIRHNAEAEEHFNLGRFKQAAEAYEKAYKAKPLPVFLHNMAQCYKRMKTLEALEKADFYFHSYLQNAPNAQNRKEIEQEIAALQPRINKLRKEREAAKSAAFQRPRGATPDDPTGGQHAKPVYHKWWFWTAIGVAVAAGATATALVLTRDQEPDNVSGSWGEVPF